MGILLTRLWFEIIPVAWSCFYAARSRRPGTVGSVPHLRFQPTSTEEAVDAVDITASWPGQTGACAPPARRDLPRAQRRPRKVIGPPRAWHLDVGKRRRSRVITACCREPDDARSLPPSDRAAIHARRPSARGSGHAHLHRAPQRSALVWRAFPAAP